MDSECIPCSLLQGQESEYKKEKFIALRSSVACCGGSSKGVIAMKKMISLTFFAFTPAYGLYVADKAMTEEPVEGDSAVAVACKGLYGFKKTGLVVTR
jgi:hypothetical protein